VEEALPSLRQLLDESEKTAGAVRKLRGLEVTLMRYQGELAGAIDSLQSLRREARADGDLRELRLLNLELAMACIWQEAGEEEELEAMLHETGDLTKWSMWPVVLARCLLSVQRARQGEAEAARQLLAKAREQGAEHDSTMGESYLSWAEAHLAMAEGHWPEALAAFETAIDLLGRAKLRWYRARTLIDWAEAYLARGESGDHGRAGELLREAEAEFESMGAPIYVERIKGRLEELGAGSSVP
jgi:tetratricopeptide (TPR) repeat protein